MDSEKIMASTTYYDQKKLAEYLAEIARRAATLYIKTDKRGKLEGGGHRGLEAFADTVARHMKNPAIAVQIVSAPVKKGKVDRDAIKWAREFAQMMADRGIKPIIISEFDEILKSIGRRVPEAETGLLLKYNLYEMGLYQPWDHLTLLGCSHVIYEPAEPIDLAMYVGFLTNLAKSGSDQWYSAWIKTGEIEPKTAISIAYGGMGVIVPANVARRLTR